MILREPTDMSYLSEERQNDTKEAQWGFDLLDLEAITQRWGIRAVLSELEQIHQRLTPDGSKVLWQVLSAAYISESYDDPNPCNCDEF